MHKHKTRLMAVSGATLALVVASTAAVAAFPGDRDDQRGFPGKGRPGVGAKEMPMPGARAGMRGGFRGMLDDLERREMTVQTADGVTVQRVEQGVVDSASDASISFTLGSGEAVTVTIDDDTDVVTFEEQTVERGRRSRQRMVPTEVGPTEIEAGAEVFVWSDSEDGSDFVASRVVLQPADDADDEADAEEAEAEEITEEAEAAVTTDA